MLSGFVKPEFTAVADAFYRTLPEGQKAGGAALCVYYRGQPVVDIWAGSRNRQNEA